MKWIKCTLVCILGIALGNTILPASEKPAEVKLMEHVKPVPSALLINSYRYMGKLKSFSIDAITTSDDVFLDKMIVTYTHHIQIKLKRPEKLYISNYGDLKDKVYYLNSGHFTVYDRDLNYYGKLDVPVTVDKALDHLFELYHIKTSLANILYRDLDRRIPPKSRGYYFGESEIDTVACHHIGFVSEIQEYQVWIEKGERPLIRKFMIIDKIDPFLPRSETVLQWKLDEKLDDALFVFNAPKTAKEINITPADSWEAE